MGVERVIVLDTETTGLKVDEAYVVEVCVRALGDERPVLVRRVRPPVPIPVEATGTHGITDADVVDAPTFGMIADELAEYLSWASVIVGYNPDYDLEILKNEMRRAGRDVRLTNTIVCCKRLWDIYDPPPKRHLQAAYESFVDPSGFKGAHGALADVAATVQVLNAQRALFDLIGKPWQDLDPERAKWIGPSNHVVWKDDLVIVNFGKNQGREFSTLDYGYTKYLVEKDFPPHVKAICEQIQKIWKQKIPNPPLAIALWVKENFR